MVTDLSSGGALPLKGTACAPFKMTGSDGPYFLRFFLFFFDSH